MDILKNITFSIALSLIGSVFLFLGLSGGFIIGSYSFIVQDTLPRVISFLIGAIFVFAAIYLENRASSIKAEVSASINEKTDFKDATRGLADHELYLKRKDIHWASYDGKVSRKFWVCGTSLISVCERGLIEKFVRNGVEDIRVLIPYADSFYASYEQLEKYNQSKEPPVEDQIDLVKRSFEGFKAISLSLRNRGIPDILKRYGGIMYSNITIIDDDAFISLYDSTGRGDNNITLHFNKSKNERGYHRAEEEFLRMWDSPGSYGMKTKKKLGTSVLFINGVNQVLLALRDDREDIPFPNRWDILGGNLEDQETPVVTITRETKEELGVKLDNPKLFNVYEMPDRIECTFWRRAEFDLNKVKLNEGKGLKWFTEDEIKNMPDNEIAFGFKPIILDFFHKKPFIS